MNHTCTSDATRGNGWSTTWKQSTWTRTPATPASTAGRPAPPGTPTSSTSPDTTDRRTSRHSYETQAFSVNFLFFAMANTDCLRITVFFFYFLKLVKGVSSRYLPQIYKNFKVWLVFKIPPLCRQYFSSGPMFNANIRQLRYLY
jgi:hypothetical protein